MYHTFTLVNNMDCISVGVSLCLYAYESLRVTYAMLVQAELMLQKTFCLSLHWWRAGRKFGPPAPFILLQ